jgi:hypothetical protein
MAVWLLHDEYDYIDKENYVSATRLMKPLRHILLPSRIPEAQRIPPDVEDYIATAMGQALHAGIEKAWLDGRHVRALKRMGFPEAMIKRVLINPTPEELKSIPDPIPVYIEQRAFREIDGYTIGGKFDMVCEGRVTDTKSTSVWGWIYGGKDEDYRLQGSIYRWLNPMKITEDLMRINFIFTDWNKQDSILKSETGYPARRVMHKDIPLMSLEETEVWIRAKLALLTKHQKTSEELLPECTEEELWMSPAKHKYYSDPTKVGQPGSRSTKNFDDLTEAQKFLIEKGKGTIVTVPGTPKRCMYCAAFPICTQKDKYTHD